MSADGKRAEALVRELAAEIDTLMDAGSCALRVVLRAWRDNGGDNHSWDAIGTIAGLGQANYYPEHPDSVREIRTASVRVLATLGHAVAELSGDRDPDDAWGFHFHYVAAMRMALVDLGDALAALEADAARMVTA